uniref:Integrase catalytic domain-containing protein n=1 Tax=Peronospora matthiolae TaxID=2874970 RepID=A0AAV1TIA0_9STRA
MNPRDRLGNHYLVNFIEHRSNYCRVFLAKTKDVAALKFKHFLVQFEREFNCKIYCLRTDGGEEYKNSDVFCKATGVLRQVSETRNQSSNGKAERMHRTIMNMVRIMVFASNLPLTFWDDAAEYATYILNRSRTKSNPGGISPMEFLTKKVPKSTDTITFNSTCTICADAWRARKGGY